MSNLYLSRLQNVRTRRNGIEAGDLGSLRIDRIERIAAENQPAPDRDPGIEIPVFVGCRSNDLGAAHGVLFDIEGRYRLNAGIFPYTFLNPFRRLWRL
jgi:hypothetical protein